MKLFVGNISWDATDADLRDAFSKFGEITEAIVLRNREDNRSKGFGFVTFANAGDAQNAISEMNGKEFLGRALTVNEARPKAA